MINFNSEGQLGLDFESDKMKQNLIAQICTNGNFTLAYEISFCLGFDNVDSQTNFKYYQLNQLLHLYSTVHFPFWSVALWTIKVTQLILFEEIYQL